MHVSTPFRVSSRSPWVRPFRERGADLEQEGNEF